MYLSGRIHIFGVIVSIFLMSLSSTAYAQFFAELSYKLWNGDCPKKIETEQKSKGSTTEAGACVTCSTSNSDALARIRLMKASFGEAAEGAYLAGLAEQRTSQLDCTQTQISNLQKNPADLNKFINDFAAKLTLIGTEKRRMSDLKKNISFDKNALPEYEKSKLRAAALLESLPFTEFAPIRQVINYVILQHETYEPTRLEGWLSKQAKELIRKALSSSLETVKSNQAVMKKGVETFGASLDGSARESLAQDTDLVESFRNTNSAIQKDLKPIACQVDAKYGRGAQYRDRTLLAVSVLGSGAALGFTNVGVVGLTSSLTGAAAVGSISIRTAGILRVLAAAGGTAASLSQTHKACFGQDVSLSAQSAKNKTASSCEGNILAYQTSENCLLVSALNALGVSATTKSARDALGQIAKGRSEAASAIAATATKEATIGSKGLQDSKGTATARIEASKKNTGKSSTTEQGSDVASAGKVTAAQSDSVVKIDPEKLKSSPQLEIWRLAESGASQQASKLTREIEEGLKSSRIVTVQELGATASKPRLVTLENGLKGVWKKMEGSYTSGNAEIAAYQVDQKLGLHHVPITVEKELNGVKGTLQIFVEGTDNVPVKGNPGYFTWFDNLIRNRDRHGGNYLTAQGRPIAIDHGLSFDYPDGWKKDPDFFGDIRKVATPLEQQYKKVQVIEARLEDATTKYGKESTEYKSLAAELGPKLLAEKAKEKEVLAIAQNNLSVMLPDRNVYQKLKNTSDQDWVATLKDQLSTDQIANFLSRRDEIVSGVDRIQKLFGDDVFRNGPVSPLVRQASVALKNPGKNGDLDFFLDLMRKQPEVFKKERPLEHRMFKPDEFFIHDNLIRGRGDKPALFDRFQFKPVDLKKFDFHDINHHNPDKNALFLNILDGPGKPAVDVHAFRKLLKQLDEISGKKSDKKDP